VLIDTAHDKPQAPEGPTYHIENKGKPSCTTVSAGLRAWTDARSERCDVLASLFWSLGMTPTVV